MGTVLLLPFPEGKEAREPSLCFMFHHLNLCVTHKHGALVFKAAHDTDD